MTAKEKLLRIVADLPETEVGPTLEFVASRREEGDVEDWGNLDAQMEAAMRESLRELDDEERKAGFEPWLP